MATENHSTTETAADPVELINEAQIRLEEIASVARVTSESAQDTDFDGILCVIEREIQAVRDDLSDVIGAIKPEGSFEDSVRDALQIDAIDRDAAVGLLVNKGGKKPDEAKAAVEAWTLRDQADAEIETRRLLEGGAA